MSGNHEKEKILLVDDEVYVTELLGRYLRDEGYDVRAVNDGAEAIKVARSWLPDLIILDIVMPGINGYQVCMAVKGDKLTRSIPVLMVTALGTSDAKEKGVGAGADDFISKPFDMVELLTRVRCLLKVRYLEGELERTLAYIEELERSGNPAYGGQREDRHGI